MKKVFMILITVTILILMVGGVSGVDVTQNDLKNPGAVHQVSNVEVVLTLDDVFKVTIPTGFVFEEDKNHYFTDNQPVKLYVGRLNASLMVNVSVNSTQYVSANNPDKYWNLSDNIGTTPDIQYLMKAGVSDEDHIENGDTLVASDDVILSNYTSQDVYLHVKIPVKSDQLGITGKYNDTLTFNVKLVEKSV